MAAIDQLLEALRVVPLGHGAFQGGVVERNLPRLFGGQVIAQALMAAGNSVPVERPLHSCHSYFLRGGSPVQEVRFQVDVLRDGRRYSVRRVTAEQGGRVLLSMMASFHEPETAVIQHSDEGVGNLPTEARPWEEWRGECPFDLPEWWATDGPFELRFLMRPSGLIGGSAATEEQVVWARPRREVGNDPLLSSALLAYAVDLNMLDAALAGHGRSWYGSSPVAGASLDYAMWIHNARAWNGWIAMRCDSPVANHGRGFTRAAVSAEDGTLWATVTQEGVLRPASPR